MDCMCVKAEIGTGAPLVVAAAALAVGAPEFGVVAAGANVDVVHRVRRLGEAGQHFQHHVILIQLRKDGRNQPLPEGVIKRVVDGLTEGFPCRDAVSRSMVMFVLSPPLS